MLVGDAAEPRLDTPSERRVGRGEIGRLQLEQRADVPLAVDAAEARGERRAARRGVLTDQRTKPVRAGERADRLEQRASDAAPPVLRRDQQIEEDSGRRVDVERDQPDLSGEPVVTRARGRRVAVERDRLVRGTARLSRDELGQTRGLDPVHREELLVGNAVGASTWSTRTVSDRRSPRGRARVRDSRTSFAREPASF